MVEFTICQWHGQGYEPIPKVLAVFMKKSEAGFLWSLARLLVSVVD